MKTEKKPPHERIEPMHKYTTLSLNIATTLRGTLMPGSLSAESPVRLERVYGTSEITIRYRYYTLRMALSEAQRLRDYLINPPARHEKDSAIPFVIGCDADELIISTTRQMLNLKGESTRMAVTKSKFGAILWDDLDGGIVRIGANVQDVAKLVEFLNEALEAAR